MTKADLVGRDCPQKSRFRLVGATRFELATPCTPCKCATRLRHAPTGKRMIAQLGREGFKSRRASAAQDLDQFLEFQSHLMDQLLALIEVDLRIITRQAVTRAANGESLLIQQAANLANDQHVLPLIVASI